MNMSGESLLLILVVGVIAGWLAGQIVHGTGVGLVGDLVIGVIGAFIGSWLLPQLGVHLGSGIVAAIAECDNRGHSAVVPDHSGSWWRPPKEVGGVRSPVVDERVLGARLVQVARAVFK